MGPKRNKVRLGTSKYSKWEAKPDLLLLGMKRCLFVERGL
jgi:hypothetical protein